MDRSFHGEEGFEKMNLNWFSRTQHAEAKAVQAGESAELARDEAKIARTVAKELAPDYHQPGIVIFTTPILKNF